MTSWIAGVDTGVLELPLFTDQHRARVRALGAWCAEHTELWADRAPQVADKTVRATVRALADHGVFARLDGGGDLREICLARQVLAHTDDLADYAYSIQALSITPLLRHGDDAQRDRFLPGLVSGELLGAFAVSELAAGSDVSAVGLRAERTPDGYVLTGGKAWVANGDIADVITVLARTGEGPGVLGLSTFLVPTDTPGLRVADRVALTAPRPIAHLELDGCHVPAANRLGAGGGGFAVVADVLDRFRMTVGAAALGFARRALDAALDRAAGRTIRRGTLLDLPTVRAEIADLEVRVAAADLLVARAAWEADCGVRGQRGFPRTSAMAKLLATETAQEAVDTAVQVFGAAGLVADSLPERLYRQIRSLRIYEGPSEVQRSIVAESLRPGRR